MMKNGTEKQQVWAEKIKATMLTEITEAIEKQSSKFDGNHDHAKVQKTLNALKLTEKTIKRMMDALWFINARDLTVFSLATAAYEKQNGEKPNWQNGHQRLEHKQFAGYVDFVLQSKK